jgi:hypothetical protein
MYDVKRMNTAAGTARIGLPVRTPAFWVLLLALGEPALPVVVEYDDISVELMTGEVGDRVTVDAPCCTSKYMP